MQDQDEIVLGVGGWLLRVGGKVNDFSIRFHAIPEFEFNRTITPVNELLTDGTKDEEE